MCPTPCTGDSRVCSSGTDRQRASASADALQLNSVAERHGKALWKLVWYDPANARSRELEEAILLLRDAAAAARCSECLSDLGAAYILRAQRDNQPRDLMLALSVLSDACEIDPGLPAARFNLALALTHLGLRRPALQAWLAYLELAPDRPWAEEAEGHRERLVASPPAAGWSDLERELLAGGAASASALRNALGLCPQCAREFVLDKLLAAWATAAPNSERAHCLLATSRVLGAALADSTGESMARDAVAVIDLALAGDDRDRIERLRCGHRSYGWGRKLFDRLETGRALTQLERARDCLARARSPLRHQAEVWLAGAAIYRGESSRAEAMCEQLSASEKLARYPALAGKLYWAQALIYGRGGRYALALESALASEQAYRQIGESANRGAVLSLQAELYDRLGRQEDAWKARRLALQQFALQPEARRLHNLVRDAATAALAAGHPRAALALQDEGVAITRKHSATSPQMAAEALLWRSKIHHRLGDDDSGLADLGAARSLNAEIADSGIRERNLASIDQAEGAILARRQPDLAAERLGKAIDLYERLGLAPNLSESYLARARLQRLRGAMEDAAADLERSIALHREHRAAIPSAELRRTHLEQAQELYDEMISLQAELGNPPRARAYSELARRVLPEQDAGSDVTALPGELELERRLHLLPPGLAVVEYALLEDGLLIWSIDSGGVEMHRLKVDPQALRSLAERFVAHLVQDASSPATEALAAQLYDLLLAPAAQRTEAAGQLILIPDKFLNAVPFAALRDRRRGRLLVAERAVAIAPSLAALLHTLERRRPILSKSAAMLAVSPAFDGRRYPHLPPLPGAVRESAALAHRFPGALHLDGAAATERRFLAELADRTIVHFAGHAIPNSLWTLDSHLLLAPGPEPEDDGALHARELDALTLEDLRLVVLSACGSLTPSEARTEGLSSLARPFLAAGADAVVGTLWPIDDEATSRMISSFYDHLAEIGQPAEALRRAQLAFLQDPDSSATWAAFQVVGTLSPAAADN